MRHLAVVMLVLFASSLSVSETLSERQKRQGQEMVRQQKEGDLKRRDEIVAQMNQFLGDVNKRISEDPSMKVRIAEPVKTDDITSITSQNQVHSAYDDTARIFAYVNAETARLYSEPESKEVVGSVAFSDYVEVLIKTETFADNKIADWFMVRKANGDEGWIDGRILSDEKPKVKKKEKDLIKEDPHPGRFAVPVVGVRTSNFGYRVHPVTKKAGSFHSGIDIGARLGTPVYAAADGVITVAEFKRNGYGNLIVIRHADSFATYYGHLSKIRCVKGQTVKKGDLIGNVGATGTATGPHLHFEIRKGDKALNPDTLLK